MCLIAILTQKADAFDGLTEAQSWIYDRSHLINTSAGQILEYQYKGNDGTAATISDKASLTVVALKDEELRDVEVSFLSGERHLPLPVFSGYRGNPVIIAMLEHIAQTMSSHSGGGALYFRNRIRDALAGTEVLLETHTIEYLDTQYPATRLTFQPFVDDEYLAAGDIFRQSRFSIELSDDIPGGVFSVQVSATGNDDVFERSLSLL